MDVAARKRWTQTEFLDWAERQDAPFEFDGFEPVAMTGGNAGHNRITNNILAALRARLRGTPCSYYGPDLGVETDGSKIRYPDALITCTKFPRTAKLAPGVIAVFEVISPTSGHIDRILKVREYAAVSSIRHYVIVESDSLGVMVLHRLNETSNWTTRTLTVGDTLAFPELSIEIPVSELYEDVDFPPGEPVDH